MKTVTGKSPSDSWFYGRRDWETHRKVCTGDERQFTSASSCNGDDCTSSVLCPSGWWPIECYNLAEDSGDGAYVTPGSSACTARGSNPTYMMTTTTAQVTCRYDRGTFSVVSNPTY